jgi:site-specific recombinase XerD
MSGTWQVFWVPHEEQAPRGDHSLLSRWADLEAREQACRIDPGDPFMVDPEFGVDARLTRYFTRSTFTHLASETKRNYVNDCCVFFNFLWQQGKYWSDASAEDLLDFQHWRRYSPRNADRIGGAKWNRELAALKRLYEWAVKQHYVQVSPVTMREVTSRRGEKISVPAVRAKDAKSSSVKWLTPRAYRLWRDVGLRGYTADDRRDPRWAGRNDDRNAAFADLLFSSGMRRTEGGSLLSIELPVLQDSARRYYDGRLAQAVTKSKRGRTFYVSAQALREIGTYCRTTRRAVIRRAQRQGCYEQVQGLCVVTGRTGFRQLVLHWTDHRGRKVQRAIGKIDPQERARLFTRGPDGLEPLWLWLSEDGTPFSPHSWEAVYQAGSARCRRVLADRLTEPPFMTPHMARHSFALHMLVALHHAMDERFDLTPEQRRDFRLLYGDPWRMVQDLLGHRSVETTRDIYLAPVSDLSVRSLLLEEDNPGTAELLTRIARASERVLDEVGA